MFWQINNQIYIPSSKCIELDAWTDDISRSSNGCCISEWCTRMPIMRVPTRKIVVNSQAAVSIMAARHSSEVWVMHTIFNHFTSWNLQIHGFRMFRDVQ